MEFRDFFPDRVAEPENRRVFLSDRWPEFLIRSVREEQAARIRAACLGKDKTVDRERYMLGLNVACVVEPDLNDAQLQAAWGAMGGGDLVKKMLLPGEYGALTREVSRVNGFDVPGERLVEQAKN